MSSLSISLVCGLQYSVTAQHQAEQKAKLCNLGLGAVLSHPFTNQSVIDCLFSMFEDTLISSITPGKGKGFTVHLTYDINFLSQLAFLLSWNNLSITLKRAVYPLGAIYSLYF